MLNASDCSWEFFLDNGAWKWRNTCGNGGPRVCAEIFVTLARALEAAGNIGFDMTRHHWLVRADGRVTEFRPGYPGVNRPGEPDVKIVTDGESCLPVARR